MGHIIGPSLRCWVTPEHTWPEFHLPGPGYHMQGPKLIERKGLASFDQWTHQGYPCLAG